MTHISDLRPDPQNARKHTPRNVGMVEHSLQRDGFGRSILVANDGTIIAGNATVEAAAAAGIENVIVVESDGKSIIAVKRTDVAPGSPEFTKLALSDNRAAELASWDSDVLAALADDGVDLSQFWFEDELADLLADDEPVGGNTDPDDVPEPPADPVTKRGDRWLLGRHRLLCGDSTVVTDVDRLMDGVKAAITITSPPYNVAKNSSLPNRNKYKNSSDELGDDDYLRLLIDSTTQALAHSQYVFVNVQSVSGNKIALVDYISFMRDQYADTIIWDKLTAEPAMARQVLNSRFEYVHVFSGKANRSLGTKEFWGTLDNVLPLNSRQDKGLSNVHKATFPVAFATFFIESFCNTGEHVYDPFCGTGTTTIACEELNRTCYGMELDPAYCDVIVKRWQDFTGLTATMEGS